MPASTAQATAAPVPIKLAGQDFRMSPLSDLDYGEFESWMRSRPIAIAKENIRRNPDLGQSEREVLLKQAMEISARLSMTNAEGLAVMASWAGAAYLTWLGLRKCHEELTYPDVVALLTDSRSVQEALDNFDRVNAFKTDEESGPEKGGHVRTKTQEERIKAAAVAVASQIGGQSIGP